ncbi:uncharacterized protein LOC125518812 [Triticum urartu]|nr:uncharacterized protein LOC125518812 [Triticum urartu]
MPGPGRRLPPDGSGRPPRVGGKQPLPKTIVIKPVLRLPGSGGKPPRGGELLDRAAAPEPESAPLAPSFLAAGAPPAPALKTSDPSSAAAGAARAAARPAPTVEPSAPSSVAGGETLAPVVKPSVLFSVAAGETFPPVVKPSAPSSVAAGEPPRLGDAGGEGAPRMIERAPEEESAGRGGTTGRSPAREEARASRGDKPFFGLLFIFVDHFVEDVGLDDYTQIIESLGGKVGTGINYNEATHIAVKGQVPPGARIFWEADGKTVTTTAWIENCFNMRKLLTNPCKDSSESLLPSPDMTPLATIKSRNCLSDSKISSKNCSPSNKRTSKKDEELRISQSRRKMLKFPTPDPPRVPSLPTGLYHSILVCESDSGWSESLYDHALRFKLHHNTLLPGFTTESKLSKISTKVAVGGSYSKLAGLHGKGKSLGGNFSSRNFIIYKDDSIKLLFSEDQLVDYSDAEGDKDYASFVKMITDEVFHKQPLPVDMIEWLRVISQGVAVCSPNILAHHIYLMEPFQAYGTFVVMYQLFSSIESTKGWSALSASLSHFDGWSLPRCKMLLKTYYYLDKNGNRVFYEYDVRGLLRLIWNSSKYQSRRDLQFFVQMVMKDYLRLLCDLQRALYDGGYLSHLQLNCR